MNNRKTDLLTVDLLWPKTTAMYFQALDPGTPYTECLHQLGKPHLAINIFVLFLIYEGLGLILPQNIIQTKIELLL